MNLMGLYREVNPGGIKLPQQEESFHVVILDLETDDISFHRVKDIE